MHVNFFVFRIQKNGTSAQGTSSLILGVILDPPGHRVAEGLQVLSAEAYGPQHLDLVVLGKDPMSFPLDSSVMKLQQFFGVRDFTMKRNETRSGTDFVITKVN